MSKASPRLRRARRAVAGVLALALSAGVVGAHTPVADAHVIGSQPYDDVLASAKSILDADANDCGLTRNKLAAMVLSVVWPEVGSNDTVAPAPMTLSRWDTSSGLYAFRNTSTPFQEAFWHPGIGMWQLDSAGLGAPYTAAERMNTLTASRVAARTMKDRYCASFGFSPPRPPLAYAWQPWHACGYPSTSGPCHTLYNHIYVGGDTDGLVNLTRTTSVTRMGGAISRTCEIQNLSSPVPCHRVDPALAQGQTWWTNPDTGAAPISAPFYVWKTSTREHRAWLPEDTGYSVLIHASRKLGVNARSSSASGGTTWDTDTAVCDTFAVRGFCEPRPIAGFRLTAVPRMGGDLQVVAGNFNGDAFDDLVWYSPGAGNDELWLGSNTAAGGYVRRAISIGGDFVLTAGDFEGDGFDDLLAFDDTAAIDKIFMGSAAGTFTTRTIKEMAGAYLVEAGDFDGDGRHDVLWYRAGTASDQLWFGRADRFFTRTFIDVDNSYTPVLGDFSGDGDTDIFWYGYGSRPDRVWWSNGAARTFAIRVVEVNGKYNRPFAVDLNRNGHDDVVWYASGPGIDRTWLHAPAGWTTGAIDLPGVYRQAVGDFDGAIGPDIFWYRPGPDYDSRWLAK